MDLRDPKLGAVLVAAPDATVVDPGGLIVFASAQVRSTFGFESNELIGVRVEHLLPERFRGGHLNHRRTFLDNPKSRAMGRGLELYDLHRDGHEFPVEISLSPLHAEEGTRVIAAIRDVSTRRDLERSLRAILETSLNEVYIFEADSLRFIQANEGARKNLGYTMGELLQVTPIEAVK